LEKFIPYAKLSKKKKRELDAAKRRTWAFSPVTRMPPDPKAYNRQKARRWKFDDPSDAPSVFDVLDPPHFRGTRRA
jgi:hypothetical protein